MPGSASSSPSTKPGQGVGGVVLERAEVDDQVDRRLVGPDVRPAVDARLEDREVGAGACSLVVLRARGGH